MRVAYVCADPGVPVFGTKGSSVHVQEIVRALREYGADVEIFATRFDGNAPGDLADVGIHWLSALPKGDLSAREKASLGSNRGLHALLRAKGPFDFVYERYSLWSYAGMEYARDENIPGILEVNAPLIEEQSKHRGLVDRSGAERVAQRAFDSASSIVVVSREVAAYIERFAGAMGKVHVIPNGVNPSRFRPDVEPLFERQPENFTVGFVGTLKPWHGLDVLAKSFGAITRRSSRMRLLVGGAGPEQASFAAALEAEGVLDRTTFTGAVSPDRIPGLLTSFDVALAPYPAGNDFYFSPLKVYEYMAAGLPVVASDIGQIAEIIDDGVTGILCPPGDANAFADAIIRLSYDLALCASLGRNAREAIVQRHTWRHIAAEITALAERRESGRASEELAV